MCGIILKYIDPVVEVNRRVTDGNNIHFPLVKAALVSRSPIRSNHFRLTFTMCLGWDWHYTGCGSPWKEKAERPASILGTGNDNTSIMASCRVFPVLTELARLPLLSRCIPRSALDASGLQSR